MKIQDLAKKNNESGVILLTVILVTMVLSIVAVSILSLNSSQAKSAAQVVTAIKSEQLAQGAFYQHYQRTLEGAGTSFTSVTLDGRNFTVSTADLGSGGTPNDTNEISVTVSY